MKKRLVEVDLDNLSVEFRRCLAKETNSSSLLEDLSNDDDVEVRKNVAENVNVSVETLKKLALDTNCDVRYMVTKNVNTPSESLDILAKDRYLFIRESVSAHANATTETLDYLLEKEWYNPRWTVQRNIYKHSNASEDSKRLIEKEAEYIRANINCYFSI